MKKIITIVLMLCLMIPTCLAATSYYEVEDLFMTCASFAVTESNRDGKYKEDIDLGNLDSYNTTGSTIFVILIDEKDPCIVSFSYVKNNSKAMKSIEITFEDINDVVETIDFFTFCLADTYEDIYCYNAYGQINIGNKTYKIGSRYCGLITISETTSSRYSFKTYMNQKYFTSVV